MNMINRVPFNKLRSADLLVDTVYEGGNDKNISSEVLSKLLHVGNSGGFRKCMKVIDGKKTKETAYVCIYTTALVCSASVCDSSQDAKGKEKLASL